MSQKAIDRLRLAWEAYGRGDLEALVDVFDPDVRWYGDGDPEAGCQNRQDVLRFIRQAHEDGVSVELLELRLVGDKIVAVLQRQQPPEWGGESPEPHGEIITLRNGRVSEMVVYPTVQAALEAASH